MAPLAERCSARCAAAFPWNRAIFASGGVERTGQYLSGIPPVRPRLAKRENRLCHAHANFEIGSNVIIPETE